ncbi:MAG: hypothetical protein KAQ92_05080, partial [Candidatus Aenigmarchaeota archaeon]|nr:hypothetical protein [Candidatus Aenigmarchaeota archaeon]
MILNFMDDKNMDKSLEEEMAVIDSIPDKKGKLEEVQKIIEELLGEYCALEEKYEKLGGRKTEEFKELKERIKEDIEEIEKAEDKDIPSLVGGLVKKFEKGLNALTNKKEEKDVSDGFGGLMDEVDFHTKMKSLDKKKYDEIVDELKKGEYKYKGDEDDIYY